jgi:cytochrome P450
MQHSRLDRIRGQASALRQNRLLFETLRNDRKRALLYGELAAEGFPPLVFKSVMRQGGGAAQWPGEDVYLLTARGHIDTALATGSVAPYAALDSGGRFMLGQDDLDGDPRCPHARQRKVAVDALRVDEDTLQACVDAAVERALVLPQKGHQFDLVTDVAEQAALRLVSVLFGLPARSHVLLERALRATYTRLTFQIIGRHFVPDDGLPPSGSDAALELKAKLEDEVDRAMRLDDPQEWWDEGVIPPLAAVGVRLAGSLVDRAEARTVVLGLLAGTVGNVTAAIANTIDFLFHEGDGRGGRLVDTATQAARHGDGALVRQLVERALLRRPPAPFLARTATAPLRLRDRNGGPAIVAPPGAHLLLAMGATPSPDLDALFGGAAGDPVFPHNCVGRHLALPLVHATVQRVLALPGLARDIEPASLRPRPLKKRWGSICESFPLRWQRDRRLNQQPLCVVLPIKEPVRENAIKLQALTRAGAPVVERALMDAQNVHFAWFGLVENETHLAMYTVYDGDFDAYVEHFALKVPLFDEQFRYLDGAPPTPIRLHPKEFVDMIRKYNRGPLGGYFYSAYPRVGVAAILREGLDRP